jgi:hypothetical protein
MATKTKAVSMFGAVEDKPKGGNANFQGKQVEQEKLDHLTSIFAGFAEFAKENPMEDGQQLPITDMGKDAEGNPFTPASLAITGNNILVDMAEKQGKPVGFYLVATDRPKKDDGTYDQPTKLVIRIGERPTRNRKASENGETTSEDGNAE